MNAVENVKPVGYACPRVKANTILPTLTGGSLLQASHCFPKSVWRPTIEFSTLAHTPILVLLMRLAYLIVHLQSNTPIVPSVEIAEAVFCNTRSVISIADPKYTWATLNSTFPNDPSTQVVIKDLLATGAETVSMGVELTGSVLAPS
jgi:hypothetical protein